MQNSTTCRIPLGGQRGAGLFALVDEEHFAYLSEFRWHYMDGYAARNAIPQPGTIRMHKVIMPCTAPLQIDHINGDRLDNRQCNLRIVTFHQNTMNRKQSCSNTSGYKGVSPCGDSKLNPWRAQIAMQVNGKRKVVNLGLHPTPEAASVAYEAAAKQLFGEYARQ